MVNQLGYITTKCLSFAEMDGWMDGEMEGWMDKYKLRTEKAKEVKQED